jgi:hypothetical protein
VHLSCQTWIRPKADIQERGVGAAACVCTFYAARTPARAVRWGFSVSVERTGEHMVAARRS